MSRLVSLLDLMPTTLAAVGCRGSEKSYRGLQPARSEDWKGHEMLFAARDRCGDAPDRIRSGTDPATSSTSAIFIPRFPIMQHSGYKKLSYPVLTVMKVLYEQGKWDTLFMADTRPAEELYDLRSDPHEMKNLAGDPAYAKKLTELRKELNQWIKATNDQGAVDESKTVDIEALMKSKREYYERTMKRRGLDPKISDQDYLEWWKKELGVNVK